MDEKALKKMQDDQEELAKDAENLANAQAEYDLEKQIKKRNEKFLKEKNARIWVEQSKIKLNEMEVENMFA
jgi:hypothetical protein